MLLQRDSHLARDIVLNLMHKIGLNCEIHLTGKTRKATYLAEVVHLQELLETGHIIVIVDDQYTIVIVDDQYVQLREFCSIWPRGEQTNIIISIRRLHLKEEK